jgi:hypothetical protein
MDVHVDLSEAKRVDAALVGRDGESAVKTLGLRDGRW